MLYPKEDRQNNVLMFACRTCQFSEPAASSCVFRNNLYNTVGETAGVTQDVGSDPTVGHAISPSAAALCAANPFLPLYSSSCSSFASTTTFQYGEDGDDDEEGYAGYGYNAFADGEGEKDDEERGSEDSDDFNMCTLCGQAIRCVECDSEPAEGLVVGNRPGSRVVSNSSHGSRTSAENNNNNKNNNTDNLHGYDSGYGTATASEHDGIA
jgi:hypothetical protein